MPLVTDPLGRSVHIPAAPNRIISVVPSQTELLFDLGLDEKVIGITKFCIHPEEWFRSKTHIGGTKNLSIEKIKALQPDLIIANKEENRKEQIELLSELFPVWVTDVNTVAEAIKMIEQLGIITNTTNRALEIQAACTTSFRFIKKNLQNFTPAAACYLIWKDPYMTVGGDTFISDMMHYAGFQNIYSAQKRYPEITIDNLKMEDFDWLLLSSEPYPFQQKHIDELQKQLPGKKILLVDGEYFSWYGSRMMRAGEYFGGLRGWGVQEV